MTPTNSTNLPAQAKDELTFEEKVKKRYDTAINTNSWSGQVCQLVGSIGVGIGGLMMVGSLGVGSIEGFLTSGGIAALGALAGAPLAALGSIANNAKSTRRLNELNTWIKIKELMAQDQCVKAAPPDERAF